MTEVAIGYGRVSTREQAEGNHSLENQRRDIPHFCRQRGFEFLEHFEDPGASGDEWNRPAFQAMLAFVRRNKGKVHYVVVTELSRFFRSAKDQANAISELLKLGVKVRSIREPNVDETPAGKLCGNIVGSFNQYFLDSLKDRTKESMKASAMRGFWPFGGAVGYLNRKDDIPPGQSNLIIDEQRAPFILKAFELRRCGKSKAEILRTINDAGFVTRKGKPLSAQTLDAILRNPIYCGRIHVPEWNLRVKGLHEPIVSEELFNDVQLVLEGKKLPAKRSRKGKNPDFPLTVFARCGACDKPLTGGWSTNGHSAGLRFGFYWCRNRLCRTVKVRKDVLESSFVRILETLTPKPDVLKNLPFRLNKKLRATQINSEAAVKNLQRELDKAIALKKELQRTKLRGEISQADYEETNRDFDREIADLRARLTAASAQRATIDDVLKFAKNCLRNIGEMWQRADVAHKMRVQTLFFPGGISYSQTGRCLNHGNSPLFNWLRDLASGNGLLASPTIESLNQAAEVFHQLAPIYEECSKVFNDMSTIKTEPPVMMASELLLPPSLNVAKNHQRSISHNGIEPRRTGSKSTL